MNNKLIVKKIEKYTKILSISRKEVEINVNPSIRSEIYWDKKIKKFVINCREFNDNFDVIHELGHIYLAKKINFFAFSNPSTHPNINEIIFRIVDYLLNCFVNYNLSTFEEIYPVYRNFILSLTSKRFLFISNLEFLGFLLWLYVELNYILKKEEKNTQIESYFLNQVNIFLNSSKVNKEDFNSLISDLSEFEKVKYSTNFKEILNFIRNIISSISTIFRKWDKNFINNQLDIIFSI